MGSFHLKRVYDPPDPEDGVRVLVDRLWPRGLKTEEAGVDIWCKDVAPSTELRRWFHQDSSRWEEFAHRYRQELEAQATAIEQLLAQIRGKRATLVYGARDSRHTHARVLKEVLEKRSSSRSPA